MQREEVHLVSRRLHPENQGLPGAREQEAGRARGGFESGSDKPTAGAKQHRGHDPRPTAGASER